MMQGMDPNQMQDLFQQSFIDPAMMNFEQQVIPSIQESFGAANAGSSSALNQALAQSGRDLSTMLGTQMGQFAQGQQSNALNALQSINQSVGQRAFDPIITQKQGWLNPLIGAAGTAAGTMGHAYLGGI